MFTKQTMLSKGSAVVYGAMVFKPLIFSQKSSIVDFLLGSKYVFEG